MLTNIAAFALLLTSASQAVAQRLDTEPAKPAPASISGKVLDGTGATVPGAKVTILPKDGTPSAAATSGASGDFTFAGISPGAYLVQVEAPGFARFTSVEYTVELQQAFLVPEIVLTLAGASTEVTVRTTEAIAALQIKEAEQQRVLGVFANFYVSYIPNAAPLTVKQKFSLAARDTFDWSTFLGVSAAAGIEQATNAFSGYGQGASGYGKRWGAQFADGRISDFLSHAVFASLFHQDPRYFYQGTGTKKSRLYHAVASGFVTRSDSGRTVPNYSYLLGAVTSGAISNAYYPSSDRGAGLVFTTAGVGIAGRVAQSVVEEFFLKRLTTKGSHRGQPGQDSGAAKP